MAIHQAGKRQGVDVRHGTSNMKLLHSATNTRPNRSFGFYGVRKLACAILEKAPALQKPIRSSTSLKSYVSSLTSHVPRLKSQVSCHSSPVTPSPTSSLTHSPAPSLTHSPTHPLTPSPTSSLTRSPTHPLTPSPASSLTHSPAPSLTRSPVTRHSLLVTILCLASLLLGCGAPWHGRVVHLEDGKAVIQSEGEGEIQSGRRLRIYRQKTIVHPVTGEVLDTIKDNIAEIPVAKVRKRTITASAPELEFSMMSLDDQAKAIRGSVDLMPGSIHEVGRIRDVDTENLRASCQIIVDPAELASGGILTVVRYSGTVIDPDTGEFLAIAVKPVADLQVTKIDDDIIYASYKLVDEKIGWVETDDVVVRRTGSMAMESLWFQDPPDSFSQDWIFGRNYWHAIRQYNSGLYREAILELNDVVQMDPEYKDAAYLLGLCYANLNRYEEAIPLFRDILDRDPDDAKILTSLAYAYLKQNKLQEAADAYEKLASISSRNPEVWVDLGDIYRTLGDHQKAQQAYRKALEMDPDNEEAAYELQ